MKVVDIVILDVKEKFSVIDYMIVCIGIFKRYVVFIVEYVVNEVKFFGL